MKKTIFFLYLMFLSIFTVNAQYDLSKNTQRQVIVVPQERMEDLTTSFIEANNAEVVTEFKELGWYVVLLPETTTQDEFISLCKDFNFIKKVYKDEFMEYNRDYIPNDTQFSSQWHLRQLLNDVDIDADQAWDSLPNSTPTVVAVFDGGIDISHEDLMGNIVTPYNAVTNQFSNGQFVDPVNDRHGTACSGTIAAVTNNGLGVASVGNNKVKVMSINIMTSISSIGTFGTSSTIQVSAINAAIASGCVAISMSYGGDSYSQALNDAFISAKLTARNNRGIFICASSGNGYSGTITQYPASYSAVYGIGATTSSDFRASFSNYGNVVDISAPGAGILTTDVTGSIGYNSTNYATVSGTSFSCPITAAAGALILYKNPSLTEAQVMTILAQTCDKVGGYVYSNNSLYPYSTRSNELGYGRINLYSAINATPKFGGILPPPPPPKHNIFVSNLSVTPSTQFFGQSVSISFTQTTQNPTLSSVNSTIELRFSSDVTWGNSDDIIIGTSVGSLGNGVTNVSGTLSYVLPIQPGTKYILAKCNSTNSVDESFYADNFNNRQITVVDPIVAATDLKIEFTRPTTSSTFNVTTSTIPLQWKVTNVGSAVITSFSFAYNWLNCPPNNTPCGGNAGTWTGNLLPGQFIYIPGLTSSPSTTVQASVCGTLSCPLPVGYTNTYNGKLVTINGNGTDANPTNNSVNIIFTRTSTASLDEIIIEEPKIKIYTITGSLLDINDINYLSHGMYIIHYIYSDRTEVEKIMK